MGAAIIIRTAVVTRHSVHKDDHRFDSKTGKSKRRFQRFGKKRKGKVSEFEMVRKPTTIKSDYGDGRLINV